MLWDYHVVLLCRAAAGWQVWDMDTLLGFPEPFDSYVTASFRAVEEEFAAEFRLLTAKQYIDGFSSDRTHMLNARGQWLVTPPPWPPIYNGAFGNLMRLTDFSISEPGEVLSLDLFRRRFGSPST